MNTITNFGGNVRFAPRHVYTPATEAEVLAILDRHARGKVRVGGALHSWSPAVVSDDAFIDLRHFDGVEIRREANGEVWATVGGGCRIKHLLRKLHRLAPVTIPSIGLITEQSIAGAISTATHGSGRHSLSHYIEEVRVAAYDAHTGKARIYVWNDGPELRAARCSLGCMGVILSVRFRCVPRYDVTEIVLPCETLDEVLAEEAKFPLQQFYLLPHRWSYFAQRRVVVPPARGTWLTQLYRAWWYFGIDIGLHLMLKTLACGLKSPRAIRLFYRHLLPRLILKNVTVTDRGERMLVMEHELFRHLETELFVPAEHLPQAAAFVRAVLGVFDGEAALPEAVAADLDSVGMREELLALRGTFTHHYPICFRKVLPDHALISTSAGGVHYSISFITLSEPREPFLAMASFLARSTARLFSARPHWGKWFPLNFAEVELLYPQLPEFRELCRRVDPRGVFRNEFASRVLFGEG
jgi:FAD/FMN-containing dehydrogenase